MVEKNVTRRITAAKALENAMEIQKQHEELVKKSKELLKTNVSTVAQFLNGTANSIQTYFDKRWSYFSREDAYPCLDAFMKFVYEEEKKTTKREHKLLTLS